MQAHNVHTPLSSERTSSSSLLVLLLGALACSNHDSRTSAEAEGQAEASPPAAPLEPEASWRAVAAEVKTLALQQEELTLLAAGDIGQCDDGDADGDGIRREPTAEAKATGELIARESGDVLVLGDIAYPRGTAADFRECFDPAWGLAKARMFPVPGNHEYMTQNASGYFSYFQDRLAQLAAEGVSGDPERGYYSFDRAGWHIVALNTNCRAAGVDCEEQARWLEADLAESPGCTLAFSHHPRFTSGAHNGDSEQAASKPLLDILFAHDVELLVSGHDHGYERFSALDVDGDTSASGLVQFVVGTGGTSLRPFRPGVEPVGVSRSSDTWGVSRLTLRPGEYGWEFLRAAGGSFSDSSGAVFVRCDE